MGHPTEQSSWRDHRIPSPLSQVAMLVLAGVWVQAWLRPMLGEGIRCFAISLMAAILSATCWLLLLYRKRMIACENVAGPGDNSSGRIHPFSWAFFGLMILALASTWSAWRTLETGNRLTDRVKKGEAILVWGQVASHSIVDRPSESDFWNAIPRGDKQTISLRKCQAEISGTRIQVTGQITAYLEDRKKHPPDQPPNLADVEIGDQIAIRGKFNWPAPVHNPGQFDIRQWLNESGISGQVNIKSAEDVAVIERSFRWSSLGDQLKNYFRLVVMRSISSGQRDMAAAILLGDRSLLEQEHKQRYAATGTIHILAISGLHVGILAGAFFFIGRTIGAPRRLVFFSVIALVLFYAWLVEFRAPIVRAAVLTSVFCLAGLVRRRIFSLNSLAAAILVVFLLQPVQLLNPGTHLSFLAVGSIVLLHYFRSTKKIDPLEAIRLSKQGPFRSSFRSVAGGVYEAYRYSAAVFCVCLPMVIHHFHVAAWVGLLINPIVIAPMGLALVCGFLMLLTSGWLAPVSGMFGWGCSVSLGAIDTIVAWGHSLPGGHQYLASPGGELVFLWYCILFVTMWYFGNSIRLRWLVLSFAFLMILFRSFPLPTNPDRLGSQPQLTVTFIDVGHGNCTVIRTGEGKVIVSDAGSFPNANSVVRKVSDVLWAHGIEKVDQLLISHADLDHYNAVPALLERFRVSEIIYPQHMFPSEGESIEALEQVIQESGIPVREVTDGEVLLESAKCKIQVLSPPTQQSWPGDNAQSMVVDVTYAGRSVLLTGDLEKEGIDYLLESNASGGATILQVPHHGSRNNDPVRVSEWAGAKFAVVSALDKRVQPDVVEIYESAGATVLIPNREGATLFNLYSDGTVKVRQWDHDPWWIR